MNARVAFSVLFNVYRYFMIYFGIAFVLLGWGVVTLPLGTTDFGYWVLFFAIFVVLMWVRLHPNLKPERHKRRWRDLLI